MKTISLMFVLAFVLTSCTTTHYSRDGEKVDVHHYSLAWDRDKVDLNIEKPGGMKGHLEINGSNGSRSFNKAIDGAIEALKAMKAGAK